MSTRGFLIEILLHICNVQQTSNLRLFIHFYYLQIVRKLSEFLLFPDTYSKFFFNDVTTFFMMSRLFYDVTTSKIVIPITFRNYTKHPIRVLRNKNNIT